MTKTNTKTKTKTMTKTNTKCTEHPTYAIFSKSRQFKDINYDQTRPDQTRQEREEFNLADLILELAFLLQSIDIVRFGLVLANIESRFTMRQ